MTNEMTFVDAKEVARRIPYSSMQLRRLEEQGDFPKRVHLGANRVAWVREEIDQWVEARLNARNTHEGDMK